MPADIDATCSRFREDSDLTRANRKAGKWVEVDPLLDRRGRGRVRRRQQSGGLVHPLLGRAMVQLGYDRDFDQLSDERHAAVPWTAPGPVPRQLAGDRVDHTGAIPGRHRARPRLGRQGLGRRHDRRRDRAGARRPAIVSLGGDIRIACPDWDPWHVAISEKPGGRPADALVGLVCGGLATSSTQVRRWKRGGVVRHHLLDPRTGRPAAEVWRTVTAIGSSCTAANTASTASVVLGRTRSGLARRPGRHRPARRRRRKGHPHRQLAGRGLERSQLRESLGLEGPILWYLNRSTGVVTIVLLTVTTVLGVLAIGGRPAGRVPRFVTQAFHRNVALLSVLLLVVHLVTAVLDEFVEIRWWEAFMPFGATYEPLWVGFGAIAIDLMIVVVVTSLFRTRMGREPGGGCT